MSFKRTPDKNFATDGIPPLSDRQGLTSLVSENEHLEAKVEKGKFGLYPDLHLKGGAILWAMYERDQGFTWASEGDIQGYVKELLLEIIGSVGLSGKIKFCNELSVFDLRADIWLVLLDGKPIGVVDVKAPRDGILESLLIFGQVYDYMLRLQSFFGLRDVFGLLTTYSSSRVFWLPQSDARARAKQPLTPLAEVKADMDEDEVYSETDAAEEVPKGSPPPERKLIATQIYPWNHAKLPQVLAALIVKMYEARFSRGVVRLIDSTRPYIRIDAQQWSWILYTFPEKFRLHHQVLPTASELILLRDLGHGEDGRVWQACSNHGVGCAIKFALGDDSVSLTKLRQELANWKKLYPDKGANIVTLGGKQSLMMPFVHRVASDEWSIIQKSAIKEAVESLAAKGFKHLDLRPAHVGFLSPIKGKKTEVILIDLAQVDTKVKSSLREAALKEMLEKLHLDEWL